MNSAAPLLAYELGGVILLALISAVAFATILAVVAGLTITASASFAHDVYANVIKSGETSARTRRSRSPGAPRVVIGTLAIIGGILVNGLNIAFLVALAFAVAASANLPTILYSLFWKKFNTTGALCSIYGGLAQLRAADHLLAGGVRREERDLQGRRLRTSSRCPTRASCRSRCRSSSASSAPTSGPSGEVNLAKFAEMEVRSLTGAGSEKAISH